MPKPRPPQAAGMLQTMFHEVPDVLSGEQVAELRRIAAAATFIDGRISNPHNPTKKNAQIDLQTDAFRSSARIIALGLQTCAEFHDYAFPVKFAPPMMCRYTPGMEYGQHVDSALVNSPNGSIRSDVSCTVFLSDPGEYEGGELSIKIGTRTVEMKLPPGHAVIYPSTTIHEVRPVTRGERLVAITFIESQICDERQRELLFELGEIAGIEGATMSWENRVRLEHVRQSLQRMWST